MAATPSLVAVLKQDGAPFGFVFDPETCGVRPSGTVRVPSDRAKELWAIGEAGVPHSAGLLVRSAGSRAMLSRTIAIAPGTMLAISIEPAVGSPKPTPTGSDVATGVLAAISFFFAHRVHPSPRQRRTSAKAPVEQQGETRMTPRIRTTLMAAALAIGTTAFAAGKTPMVGGAAMYPSKTIVENASQSSDHTTLVAAVKAAGLADTLSGPGPFTVFAPTNAAFGKLPAGTVDTLVRPDNKAQLTSILTYHVVPGRITAKDIAAMAKAHGGTATYVTVQGEPLMFRQAGKGFAIMDGKGDTGQITIADVMQSNGVVHVVDTVMMP